MTNQRGFTLIEMSIVLALVGLIVGVGIFSVGALTDRGKLIQTNTNLDQAEAALALFVTRNNRLPCPADGSLAIGAANYGVEQVTSAVGNVPQSCPIAPSNSVLPWITLGLDEGTSADGWGRRLSYIPAGAQANSGWNSLVDPGLPGSGASATATLTSNRISAITMISSGSGYTSDTTVSFIGGGGSGTESTTILTPSSGAFISGPIAPLPTVNYLSPPNVVFHSAGCLSRTSGITNTGRSTRCDPAPQALAPSYPYGNYIAVYSILGNASSTELTRAQPVGTIDSTTVATAGGRAAYVLISHGQSGWYGWQKGGGQIMPPAGTVPVLKQFNSAATAGVAGISQGFVQGTPQGVLRNGPTANYFDDIVRWRTPAMIIQLCGAGACGNP